MESTNTTAPDTSSTAPGDGNRRAFLLLWALYAVAPILFGLDKFVGLLTDDWERYLAPWIDNLVPGSAHDNMLIVGAIEIVAGLVVAFAPRFGGYLVAAWLTGIIVSLLSVGGYADIALRDFGLLVGAVALAFLASAQRANPRK